MVDTLDKLEAVAGDDLLRQLHAIAITVDIDEYGLPLNVVGAPATDAMLKMRAAVASFADRIRAQQREVDAQRCEDRAVTWGGDPPDGQEREWMWMCDEAVNCASAIRSTAADEMNKKPAPRLSDLRGLLKPEQVAQSEPDDTALLREAAEALEPFAALHDMREARYAKRGGSFHVFSDAHPAFDIKAQELRLGAWRKAASVAALLRQRLEGSKP